MSPVLAVMLFLILLGTLGILIAWEYRRAREPRKISPEALRRQIDGPFPYTAPPERLSRSMDRVRTA